MTDEKRITAALQSTNSEDIGPPYGVARSYIMLGKVAGKELETAGFSITQGIIDCPMDCRVYVRFDDAEPELIKASSPGSGSHRSVFFEDPATFAKKLSAAKRIRVRPQLYGSGSAVFEFNQDAALSW